MAYGEDARRLSSRPHDARTRQFYEAVGFEPLETFETLRGEGTPCLLMLKPLW